MIKDKIEKVKLFEEGVKIEESKKEEPIKDEIEKVKLFEEGAKIEKESRKEETIKDKIEKFKLFEEEVKIEEESIKEKNIKYNLDDLEHEFKHKSNYIQKEIKERKKQLCDDTGDLENFINIKDKDLKSLKESYNNKILEVKKRYEREKEYFIDLKIEKYISKKRPLEIVKEAYLKNKIIKLTRELKANYDDLDKREKLKKQIDDIEVKREEIFSYIRVLDSNTKKKKK